MPYRHDGGGMGGPMPDKTEGWLWGFLFGAFAGAAVTAYLMWG
jgi:hypothetical protein